jgi:hypothetical protein
MNSPASSGARTIWQLDGERWVDTRVVIDPLAHSKEDVLSIGDKLYIVSRWSANLRRFSYDGGTYQLDAGFPVRVPTGNPEALTLARDSRGILWLAWEQSNSIRVARTDGDDRTWRTPYILPVDGASDVDSDDIAAVIAFTDATGPAIGVMWSNQRRHQQLFAVHRDGAPDSAWTVETALSGPQEADDHINLKTHGQRVFAAVKTSHNTSNSPLIKALARSADGKWSSHNVAMYQKKKGERNTRPILMVLDAAQQDVYVLMAHGEGSEARGIVYKRASMNGLDFKEPAQWLIRAPGNEEIDDVTSMKANATAQTGIVVLASDLTHFWWGRLGGNSSPPPSDEPSEPPPPPPPPPGDTVTVTADADAYVRQGRDINYGTASELRVREASTSYHAYLAFDVPTTPSSAVLRLYVTDPSPAGGRVHVTATSWDERTITWNNAPPPQSAVGEVGRAELGRWVEVDVSAAVQAAGRHSFAIVGVSGDSALYSSREGLHPPQLVVDTSDVATPPPSDEPSEPPPPPPPPPGDTVTVTADADAYVRQGRDINYGTASELRVREASTSYHAYLAFDVPTTPSSAVLRLYVTDPSPAGGRVHVTATSWDERTITWNNAPPPQSAVGEVGRAELGRWVEVDVSAAVQAAGRHSFAIVGVSGDSALYSSREGLNPPQLVLR